ncbi:trans-sulfuration enzyme family protein [Cellulomonas denverensis]|uniref:homocysteine desulfhydrase n=1 Tax=Cellulomonas denverensis TaxID=264297 RepID=A0A7X6KXS2_9CELL|nr:aminotransferase class I/II-fold pyridoxal phosphate-dependent enzyme [Cellulomonas denverensis]NKY24162.1 aminotransferase class I/II-fold pyridoxal phosphate-dependent enzyme [Cellulomonas denverensis]GIG25340.1 cystathionine gamma-synthase [Cellulomonas denverensis]
MTQDHDPRQLSPATVAVSAGRPARVQGAPVNPPVVFSSTYVSQGTPGPAPELLYARGGTETWLPFEETLAALEGAELPALVYGSGMAAIAAALSLIPHGGRVVVPRHAYQVLHGYLADLADRSRVEVEVVDIADTDQVVAALRPGTSMLWIESPTNPMLEVADLPALVAAAREVGALTVVDNTFATPLVQRPLSLGADVVVHSVTKYLAGHSDVVLGAALSDDPELHARLLAYRTLHGAIAGPAEVYLALRGVRTLALRVERAQANALDLAHRLAEHPRVAEVRHPGLPTDPGHTRATAQMAGYGAIIGLRPTGGPERADAVVAALRLWVPATSLGGVESSIERRRRFGTESVTVPEDLLRLSVGIEDVEDLWADLDRALRES